MSAKASGVDTSSSSSSARNRDHQHGKQDREYTSAQKAAVDRVRKCKATAYYEILNIKIEADDGEIRKAYKKLALVMHPDKNGAPGADEAFKLIAKAFQVLSDPQKRAIYDKTGGDPESRSFGGSQAGGGGPFAGFPGRGPGTPGRHPFADEVSPEELFNMFFGGGGAFGGAGTFFDLGGGGPGIRIHRFGGPTPRRRPNPNAQEGEADGENSIGSTIIRLLPLILIFVFSLLSSMLSGFGGVPGETAPSYNGPPIKFAPRMPYTEKRLTPTHKIPFYVNPVDIANYPQTKLNRMDRFAETQYIRGLQAECEREYNKKQERIQESQGWFFVDQKKLQDAVNTPLASCHRLKELGVVWSGRH
ncbi:hypothetical protein TWF696_000036 [Orbilia brochopaga]|uniref:J domain-containing protein n=1 Tax=Orbilia brochopaga TaxID=3140254 RepID=A0AAV9VCK7_9PEZI